MEERNETKVEVLKGVGAKKHPAGFFGPAGYSRRRRSCLLCLSGFYAINFCKHKKALFSFLMTVLSGIPLHGSMFS